MILQRTLIIILGLFFSFTSFSQNNINGTWNGIFLSPMLDLGQPKLVIEIYDFKDSIFTGISHLYYKGNQYEHYKIVGRYSKKDSILIFKESATIAVDLGRYGNCLGTYIARLSSVGNRQVQNGIWQSNIPGCSPLTKIYLEKKKEVIAPVAPIAKTPAKVKPPAPAKKPAAPATVNGKKIAPVVTTTVTPAPAPKMIPAIKNIPIKMPAPIAQRATDVQSLLEISSAEKDSIKVEVYDNGEIDGDSVSVYEENVQRIATKMITAKPITFYMSLDKNVNPIAHLRLVAESLGSIPPCTALMIVTTKSKRYEVHLSSNFSKNATVELFLKE